MTALMVTLFALIAFAANSLLCRMALGGGLIDPVSFTTIRLVSGAIALIPLARLFGEAQEPGRSKGSWGSGIALFAYASGFSLAYVHLTTGTGALILVGAVQVTMISRALKAGERMGILGWTGLATAIGGLIYLLSPGISGPDPLSALLMGAAGAAWGIYSIRGKGARTPIAMTAGNFLRAAPMALIVSLAVLSSLHMEWTGVVLGLISGVVTSGMGYVLWYIALRNLTTSQASVVQLFVPVLAAIAGILFLSEQFSLRLLVSGLLILGGIAAIVIPRGQRP